MNRLMLARHGYESLAGALQQSLNEHVSDQAEAWLEQEVCPVAEELFLDRSFRRLALWSLEHFGKGSETDERHLLERVEEELLGFGRIASRIIDTHPASITNDFQRNSVAEGDGFEVTAVRLMASKPWFDFVCGQDFLHPAQELFLVNPAPQHTERFRQGPEWRVPLGDYVARMMLARVEYWKTLLDEVFMRIFLVEQGRLPFAAREELFSAKLQVDQACNRLVRACHQSESKLREAATTLVQVYAAYAPSPKLDWLPFLPSWLQVQRDPIRSCIRRRGAIVTAEQWGGRLREVHREDTLLCDPMVLRQIAAALEDLTSLYELPSGNRERLTWAVDRARLVMVDDRPRTVYWDGEAIAEDAWCGHEREWDLLWTLARNARGVVNQAMLMNPDGQVIRSRRHRLKQLLNCSPTLDELIETRRSEGYSLALDSDLVLLLRNESGQLVVM